VDLQLHAFLTLVLLADGDEWSDSHPGHFIPGKRTPVTTGWQVEWAPESVWTQWR